MARLSGLMLVLAIAIAACGGATEEEPAVEGPVSVGFVIPDFSQNELMIALKAGADDAAAEYGAEITAVGSNSADELVAGIENAIAAGVDVLVYNTIDNQAIIPAIEAANAAGVPVVCTVNCAGGGGEGGSVVGEHAMTFGFDYRNDVGPKIGEWAADIAESLAQDSVKLALIDANRADAGVQNMFDGIDEVLRDRALSVEQVISPPTNWDRAAAADEARTLLTANPDVDIIIGLHDIITAGTLTAMNELGYRDTPLAGVGGTCEGFSNILQGTQDITVYLPLYDAGYAAVETAVKVARGEAVEGGNHPIDSIFIDRDLVQAVVDGSHDGVVDGVSIKSLVDRAAEGC